MKWVRRTLVVVFSVILLLCIFIVSLSSAGIITLTHPDKVESWLSQSNFYDTLPQTISEQAKSALDNNLSAGDTVSSNAVNKAVESSFPEAFLKSSTQSFITSNYAWLQGKTAEPVFNINLSMEKDQFASDVIQQSVTAHLLNLQTCSAAQTAQLENANPLLLSCRPAGISSAAISQQLVQQFEKSSDFLANPIISASTLPTKAISQNEPYYVKLEKLPKAYRLAQKVPWIVSIIALLSIVVILFAAQTKRIGIRWVSIVLILSGFLMLIARFLTNRVLNKAQNEAFANVSGPVRSSLTDFIHLLERQLEKIELWFVIGSVALGLLFLIILLATKKKQGHPAPKLGSSKIREQPQSVNRPKKAQIKPQNIPFSAQRSNTRVSPATDLRKPPEALKQRKNPRPPRLIQ